MNKTELDLKEANLDDYTMAYLERVSNLKGQAALNAWLTYTGWIFSGTEGQKGIQISIQARLKNAVLKARATKWTPRKYDRDELLEKLEEYIETTDEN